MKQIKIKVIVNAKKNELIKISDNEYKVRITAPAVEGKANAAIIDFLAKEFEVKKSKIKIEKGEKSKNKIIEME